MTTRILINEQSPWPERVGCLGAIVEPPEHRRSNYPAAGMLPSQAVVLLDDDPLAPVAAFVQRDPDDAWWTCVMPMRAVEFLPEDPA